MDEAAEFEKTSRELLELLDRQVATIYERNFKDLTGVEAGAYQNRKRRILELRAKLAKLLQKKPHT